MIIPLIIGPKDTSRGYFAGRPPAHINGQEYDGRTYVNGSIARVYISLIDPLSPMRQQVRTVLSDHEGRWMIENVELNRRWALIFWNDSYMAADGKPLNSFIQDHVEATPYDPPEDPSHDPPEE